MRTIRSGCHDADERWEHTRHRIVLLEGEAGRIHCPISGIQSSYPSVEKQEANVRERVTLALQ